MDRMINYILLGASVAALALGYAWRKSAAKRMEKETAAGKAPKRARTLSLLVMIVGGYLFLTRLISILFPAKEKESLSLSLWAERIDVGGYSLSKTVLYTWVIMAALILIAVILRLTVVRRFDRLPRGAQNVLETIVSQIMGYTDAQAHGVGEVLGSYIFTIAFFMIGCACMELFRLRAPTADITMTLSLALITFFLINRYAIKKKGVGGRIKSLASPTPVVFIFRIISDIAIPVSMASRLFGNMLGGMIVMDLLYMSLGSNAVGIPSVLGLYFNAFHPLIQAFIFVTLTLTFINEAVE